MRTSISKKNPYWVSKHKFLELYHFSLQYKDWEKEIAAVSFMPDDFEFDPTGEIAAKLTVLKKNCEMVKECCKDADRKLHRYLFLAVTEGLSYDALRSRYHIPCGKDYYFIRYRKYFWLLSRRRS